jgi:hypothetical protein
MKINNANGLVKLIAGRHNFGATAAVIRRSGTWPTGRRAGRVPAIPMPAIPMPAIHPLCQPAIPDEGR